MKIFLKVQELGAIIGISPNQQSFSWRSLLAIFIDCFGIASNCAHFFYEAKTFQEHIESIFVCTAIIMATTVAFYAWKSQIFFNFLYDAENMIDKSEFENILIKSIR